MKLNKNNASGYKNVCFIKREQKWTSYIYKNKKRISLGMFNSKEEAYQVYLDAGGKEPDGKSFDVNEYYKKNKAKMSASIRKYMEKNKEKVKCVALEGRRKLKFEVINQYGGVCSCCGESNITLLTLDHIDGSGSTHRKENVKVKNNFYRWLRKSGYPKDNFSVLCYNCNIGKYLNNNICPHKTTIMNDDWSGGFTTG